MVAVRCDFAVALGRRGGGAQRADALVAAQGRGRGGRSAGGKAARAGCAGGSWRSAAGG